MADRQYENQIFPRETVEKDVARSEHRPFAKAALMPNRVSGGKQPQRIAGCDDRFDEIDRRHRIVPLDIRKDIVEVPKSLVGPPDHGHGLAPLDGLGGAPDDLGRMLTKPFGDIVMVMEPASLHVGFRALDRRLFRRGQGPRLAVLVVNRESEGVLRHGSKIHCV